MEHSLYTYPVIHPICVLNVGKNENSAIHSPGYPLDW